MGSRHFTLLRPAPGSCPDSDGRTSTSSTARSSSAGEGIYTATATDGLRFAVLTRAAFECCQRMGWAPDIVHCHDWHTALAPHLPQGPLRLGPAVRPHAHGADHPQPRLPGARRHASVLDDLGLARARHWLDAADLAAGHVQLPEDRHPPRRRHHRGQPHLRAGDPDAGARLRPRRAAARPRATGWSASSTASTTASGTRRTIRTSRYHYSADDLAGKREMQARPARARRASTSARTRP